MSGELELELAKFVSSINLAVKVAVRIGLVGLVVMVGWLIFIEILDSQYREEQRQKRLESCSHPYTYAEHGSRYVYDLKCR